MSDKITERIREFMKYNSLNSLSLSKELGYKSSEKIARLFRDDSNKPSYDIIYDISNKFEINVDWLITGRGSMLKKDGEHVHKAYRAESPTEGIPLIPITAMAGVMNGEVSVMEFECERFVVPTFKGAEFLIGVKGSSMYPKYNSGDIVACKKVQMKDLFFQWNKVYVIDTDQGALIKRILPGSDKNHISIVSDNEKYAPFELPLSRIYAVALVIGVIRLE